MEGDGTATALAELRREIDRIDEAMHRLLMERGGIIDRLIETKRTGGSASAFRPDREAAMLRVLAERHRGRLPLDAVEGIWRVIISTFTHVQAPFAVHACGPAAAMRDTARFHFGFTVPYREVADAAAVVAAVAASRGDLGLVPIGPGDPWWTGLAAAGAPKIIARLPFVERPGHPAGTPVLVIAGSGAGTAAGDVALYAAARPPPDVLRDLGGEIVMEADGSALVALPAGAHVEDLAAALGERPAPIGHHPSRFRLPG